MDYVPAHINSTLSSFTGFCKVSSIQNAKTDQQSDRSLNYRCVIGLIIKSPKVKVIYFIATKH